MMETNSILKHWLSILFAALAVITFIACSQPMGTYGTGGVAIPQPYYYSEGEPNMPFSGGAPDMPVAQLQSPSQTYSVSSALPIIGYPTPNDTGQLTASDTREYLKETYDATLRTRDVQSTTDQVTTIVLGHQGRVDETQSSDTYGYVQFVIPASEYDDFKQDVQNTVGYRFISVQTSAQNLLPEKQAIESSQTATQQSMTTLQASLDKLVSQHDSTIASLQSRIGSDQAEFSQLEQQEQSSTTDESQLPSIGIQIDQVQSDLSSLQSELANENNSYSSQRNSLNAQLQNASSTQASLTQQNQDLLDTVATVNGTITVQWISVWDMARTYLPDYWIPFIFSVLSVLTFMWEKRRFREIS